MIARHTSRHTSPVDGDLVDSRKAPRSSPLKAPCLHLSQKGNSIVKKLKERALSLPWKLPAPSILANFALRFGSGSPLPLNYCVVRRLSLDVCCPSMPSKRLVGDWPRPIDHTTGYIAAFRLVLVECSMCVWFIIKRAYLICAQFR